MKYKFIDYANFDPNTLKPKESTIDIDFSENNFECMEMDVFYNYIKEFAKIVFNDSDYMKYLNSKKTYGYSRKLKTKTIVENKYMNSINTYEESTYFSLSKDESVRGYCDNPKNLVIHTINEYLGNYYDKYERRNHEEEVKRFEKRFPEYTYDPSLLKVEYICKCWYKYYKEKDLFDYYYIDYYLTQFVRYVDEDGIIYFYTGFNQTDEYVDINSNRYLMFGKNHIPSKNVNLTEYSIKWDYDRNEIQILKNKTTEFLAIFVNETIQRAMSGLSTHCYIDSICTSCLVDQYKVKYFNQNNKSNKMVL